MYSIMFMVLGAVLYLPFVHFGYVFTFMDKLTTFLQVKTNLQFKICNIANFDDHSIRKLSSSGISNLNSHNSLE